MSVSADDLADRIELAVFIVSEAGKGWAPFSAEERAAIVRALRNEQFALSLIKRLTAILEK